MRSPASRSGLRASRPGRPGRGTRADVPALLANIEGEAAATGLEEIWISAPMANAHAFEHLLARGFRIFPFTIHELASDDRVRFDRWIGTNPEFIL